MSYQNLGEVITSVQELINAVRGGTITLIQNQFTTIKSEFENIKTTFNTLKSEQVAHLNGLADSLSNRFVPVRDQTFTVGGDWNTFYPVFIPAHSARLNSFQITRNSIYENKGEINGLTPDVTPGSCSLLIQFIAGNWGHAAAMRKVVLNSHNLNQFVAQISNNSKLGGMFVWLRGGGVTYRYIGDYRQISEINTDTLHTADNLPYSIYLGGIQNKYGSYMPVTEITLPTQAL